MSALEQLQLALVDRLKTNPGMVTAVAGRVYENVAPGDTALPYVTVDAFTGVEQGSALGTLGYGHTAGVHAFGSDAEGNKQALQAAGAVKAALRTPLVLTGFGSTRLKLEFETIVEEPGKRHVPMRFRTVALEAA